MADAVRAPAWQRQRDAASRNQAAIADAAAELFRRRGVANVEVRDIAAAAGVGVGTVYRRFGDKASVIAAVIGEEERALQNALLSGPPPLGPGAPPAERLNAFLRELAALTERNLDVLAASESAAPGGRYRIGAYGVWRLHVVVLIRAASEDLDADWLAETLLAPLGAEHYRQQRREQGMSADRVVENLVVAADRLVAARSPGEAHRSSASR